MNTNNEHTIYVDDEIGTAYKSWSAGDIVLISAPTGRGKSHFILYTLLEYAILSGHKILYLVNRKILKEQLQSELTNDVAPELYNRNRIPSSDVNKYITITTYQSIENSIKSDIHTLKNWLSTFSYVIYDECHYFYADSNYNTNTELSYDCLRREFYSKVQIFISATIDKMKEIIEERNPIFLNYMHTNAAALTQKSNKPISYCIERQYNYIDIIVFDAIEELISEIKTSKNKWLIFIDSIKNGESFKESLLDKSDEIELNKNDIVFISADYEKDEDSKKSIQNLINEKKVGTKVVISTTVMDNGISFLDNELRNIVILADTEETFIQMLGRKRNDNNRISLYLCRRNIEHFRGRKHQIENILNTVNEFKTSINDIYNFRTFHNRQLVQITSLNPYTKSLYFHNCANPTENAIFWTSANSGYDLKRQENALDKISSNQEIYNKTSKVCYSLNGLLAYNSFSLKRLEDLRAYYKNMIESMETNSDAFLQEQLQWLHLDASESDKVLQFLADKYRAPIINAIQKKIGDVFRTKDNIEFKLSIRYELLYFYRKYAPTDKENFRKITRTDGTISEELFNIIMKEANLPYIMEKSGKSDFKITEIK